MPQTGALTTEKPTLDLAYLPPHLANFPHSQSAGKSLPHTTLRQNRHKTSCLSPKWSVLDFLLSLMQQVCPCTLCATPGHFGNGDITLSFYCEWIILCSIWSATKTSFTVLLGRSESWRKYMVLGEQSMIGGLLSTNYLNQPVMHNHKGAGGITPLWKKWGATSFILYSVSNQFCWF